MKSITLPDSRRLALKAQEKKKKRLAGLTVTIPAILTMVALGRWLVLGLNPMILVAFGISYLITAAGLELGYHRYFSHKAFKTSKFMEGLLAIVAATGAQGPVFYWTTFHRKHHTHTDRIGDPHSPVAPHAGDDEHGGLLHAHIGWLFHTPLQDFGSNIKDLRKMSHLKFINRHYLVWVVLGLILPTLVIALLFQITELKVLVDLLLWTGFVRIFAAQHVVWAINSLCHKIGRQSFKSGDNSRNLPLLSLLIWGAGWHNNHHAFPASASMQLKWYHFDTGFWLLKLMSMAGLIWDLRIPEKSQVESKSIKK